MLSNELENKHENIMADDLNEDNMELGKPKQYSKLQRTASNLTSKSRQFSTDNTSIDTIEVGSQQNQSEISVDSFKIPTNKKKRIPDISISLGTNIPLNIFSIFCSLALVGCFMILCLFASKTKTNISIVGTHQPSHNANLRFLNETYDPLMFNDSDTKAYNNQEFHDDDESVYNMHFNTQNFLEFIKYQRYSFFSKVENDYLVEPENQTLQIFKPDENSTKTATYHGIQQKLYEKKENIKQGTEAWNNPMEEKNKKYNSIESII